MRDLISVVPDLPNLFHEIVIDRAERTEYPVKTAPAQLMFHVFSGGLESRMFQLLDLILDIKENATSHLRLEGRKEDHDGEIIKLIETRARGIDEWRAFLSTEQFVLLQRVGPRELVPIMRGESTHQSQELPRLEIPHPSFFEGDHSSML
ncbi:hypothetical protein [Singulisphaera sp. GP187]|uniref:hypothetical protein n=1 Tax=Singulisphaera sp. GP187 TaxID=1882752 RepID=UPI00094068B1|nr:hypothetical protein [Singulisphaera sp. GP187]